MTWYTIYCTTNKINGKYYIGIHKTSDPHDSYLGSGKILKRSIAKYGVEAFDKEICCVYDNAAEAFAKEELLVRVHRRNKFCMNLRKGGAGGFDYINRSGLRTARPGSAYMRKLGAKSILSQRVTYDATRRSLTTKRWQSSAFGKETLRQFQLAGALAKRGTSMSNAQRRAVSMRQTGAGNSQYGTSWITDGQLNRKTKRTDPLPTGWRLGRYEAATPP